MNQRLTRLLVFLLPVAASLGPVVRIGPLAVARVVTILLMGLAVSAVVRHRRLPQVSAWLLLLLVVWLGWGFASMRGLSGMKELFAVAVGLGSCVALPALARPDDDGPRDLLRTLTRGWLFGWLVACPPVLWEVATGRHFPNYLEGAALWIRLSSKDAASYMVNPNLLAYFMVSAMAMMIVGWHLEGGRLRWLHLACILATPVLCGFTGSRLIQAVMPLMLLWFVARTPWFQALRRVWAALVVAGLALATVVVASTRFGAPTPKAGSVAQREALYQNGFHMIWSSLGLGVGAGGFEEQVATRKAPFDILGGPQNPHSGLFEIASQYGIGIAALAIGALLALFLLCLPAVLRGWQDPVVQGIGWDLSLFSLLVLPLSFANSSWLDSSVAFAQLATLALAASVLVLGPRSTRPRWWTGSPRGLTRHDRVLAHACRQGSPLTR